MTYLEYHAKVVQACCNLMGEQHREFFDKECSYESELAEGLTPEECAEAQYEALT